MSFCEVFELIIELIYILADKTNKNEINILKDDDKIEKQKQKKKSTSSLKALNSLIKTADLSENEIEINVK